ncbi:hypothetical protein TB2_029330 [Malus domestica]|uniref:uncharacterized protein At1g08160-like n=1 Tax=Malus domestica TaxID=3750 RepID=UPI0039770405
MPTSASQPSQAPKSKSNLIRIIAIVLLALIVLLGLVVLITWLVVKPKRLVYTIENGSIQNFNLTNDHLSANFDFVIRSYNPNKRVSIYYDSIGATVNYNDQTLAFSGVDPFYQRHQNVTRFDVKFTARSAALSSPVSKDLMLEKRSGKIQFDVWLKARIRFKVGAWKSRHRTLRVSCSPVLEFSRPKSLRRTYCYTEL